eukprot:g16078.t1
MRQFCRNILILPSLALALQDLALAGGDPSTLFGAGHGRLSRVYRARLLPRSISVAVKRSPRVEAAEMLVHEAELLCAPGEPGRTGGPRYRSLDRTRGPSTVSARALAGGPASAQYLQRRKEVRRSEVLAPQKGSKLA